MKIKKIISRHLPYYFGLIFSLLPARFILAADTLKSSGLSGIGAIDKILSGVTNFLLLLVGAVATLFLVIGGLQYITSSGDPQKTATAKKTILYAIVGIIVVLLAKVVLNIVLSLFK